MEQLLIVGCGDIARRALPQLQARYAVHALVRSEQHAASLREQGVAPILADLDRPESLLPLAGVAEHVLHLAPPNADSERDERTRNLITALSRGMLPRRVVYISTSGVYGDCQGEWVDEARPVNPQTSRARRRVDAEQVLSSWNVETAILRVPGIYASDRLPLERLRKGTPVLRPEDDVYTNHVHADDLVSAIIASLERAPAGAVYNISDDSEMKMGEWFDFVADRFNLARPPRISRGEAMQSMPPALLSFMSESRRLSNRHIKQALGFQFRYPTVHDGVPSPSIP